MQNIVDEMEYNGHQIRIGYDYDADDPRTEWEPFTEFHVKDCRYYLGEHKHASDEEINEVVKEAEKQGDMVLKLYAYIHSGTYLSLESFYGKLPQGHAEFDSGCCGVVIIRRAAALACFQKSRWSKKLRQQAYETAKCEVDTFTAYLNGEVYGFVVDEDDE